MSTITELFKPVFKTESVKAPELKEGADLMIRELSGAQQAELQARLKKDKTDESAVTAYVLYVSLVNQDGERLLKDEAQAAAFIDAVPARLINRLTQAIWKLNSGDAEKKA
jgi:hypothetical protein